MKTQDDRLKKLGTNPQVISHTFCYRAGHLKHFLVCKKACPVGREHWSCPDFLRYDRNIRLIRSLQSLARNGFRQSMLPGMEAAYVVQPELKEEE